MSLIAKIENLNKADLSVLNARIAAIKAELEKILGAEGQATASEADIKAAAKRAGVSTDEFIAALEEAKRRGLI